MFICRFACRFALVLSLALIDILCPQPLLAQSFTVAADPSTPSTVNAGSSAISKITVTPNFRNTLSLTDAAVVPSKGPQEGHHSFSFDQLACALRLPEGQTHRN